MVWIPFSERKPIEMKFVITRSPSWNGKGDAIESWRLWDNLYYYACKPAPSHWWDGEPDFDLAVKEWSKERSLSHIA